MSDADTDVLRSDNDRVLAAMDKLRVMITDSADELEAIHGLPAAHLVTLEAVQDGARSVSAIAHATLAHVSTASRTIDHLVKSGMVVRDTDPNDRRAVVIDTTPAGRSIVDTLQQDRRNAIDATLTTLGDEATQFVDLVERFVDNLAEQVAAQQAARRRAAPDP